MAQQSRGALEEQLPRAKTQHAGHNRAFLLSPTVPMEECQLSTESRQQVCDLKNEDEALQK